MLHEFGSCTGQASLRSSAITYRETTHCATMPHFGRCGDGGVLHQGDHLS
jgi:hypothetical protein